MKKLLVLTLAVMLVLCLCAPAMAAGSYTVTLINGMDNSTYATYTVAAGEDFVFTISCAAPCDMGPIADGEAGSGVTATSGTVAYSNITTGGPNAYPTAETVTISGIAADCTVTVTPNPDEVDAEFPSITEGGAASSASASGEASGEASAEPEETIEIGGVTYVVHTIDGVKYIALADVKAASEEPAGDASGEASAEPSTEMGAADESAYQEYLHAWLQEEDAGNDTMTEDIVENEFMPLIYAGDYETFPAEMLWNGMLNNGSPLTFDEWVAAQK